MSVTVLQQPPEIAFSRNPVIYRLQTNAQYSSLGQTFIAKLIWDLDAPADYSFTITFNNKLYVFRVTPNPDDSGLQIINRGTTDQLAYSQILAEGIASNRELSEAFEFTVQSDAVRSWVVMTGRKEGTEYAPTSFVSTYISMQMARSAITPVLNLNYKMLVELWVQKNTGTPFKFTEAFMEPDDDGIVTFDVSEHLTQAMLADGYEQPDMVNALAMVNSRSTIRYYLRHADVYGETQVVRKLTNTGLRYAMLGGISKEKLAEFAFPASFIAGDKLRWMKQEPLVKVILPEQPEFLSITLFDRAVTGLQIKFSLVYEDDSVLTITKYGMGAQARFTKLTFPVGFVHNNLHLVNTDKTVKRYTVELLDANDTTISEVKTYYLNFDYLPFVRSFVYLSSWGTYDTLVTYGRNSNQYELTQSTAEIVTGKGFSLTEGESIRYSISLSNTETVTSGYLERSQIRIFRDLALSWDILLYRKKRAYAVAFASNNVKEFKDADSLHAITFEYGFRYNEELFTVDDLDDIDEPMFLPRSFMGAPALPDVHTHDERYYKKTETYTKAETDADIGDKLVPIGTRVAATEAGISALGVALGGKAAIDHIHDDRYIPRAEMEDLMVKLEEVIEEGAGIDPGDIDETLKFEADKLGVDLTKVTSRADFDTLVGALVPHPTYTAPSATLTSNVSASGEVGETRVLTVSLAFNQGHAGQAYSNVIRRNASQVAVGASFNETIKLATAAVAYQGTIYYNQGAVRKNIIGIDDPVGRIEAGSKDSNTINFIGYYATWYGPAGSIPATAAAPRTLSGKQLTSAGNSFTLNSGTVQTTLVIITAPGRSLSSVVDLDALNAVITSEYVYQGTMSVNDADGVAVAGFKVYVKQMGVPYGSNHRHQVTTA